MIQNLKTLIEALKSKKDYKELNLIKEQTIYDNYINNTEVLEELELLRNYIRSLASKDNIRYSWELNNYVTSTWLSYSASIEMRSLLSQILDKCLGECEYIMISRIILHSPDDPKNMDITIDLIGVTYGTE